MRDKSINTYLSLKDVLSRRKDCLLPTILPEALSAMRSMASGRHSSPC